MRNKSVILHVGPPKTGTTYLQHRLNTNRTRLRDHGYHVLGDQTSLRDAASDLLGYTPGPGAGVPEGAWSRLREDVADQPGHVVMSCERFSLFDAARAAIVRDELAEANLHAVVTLRDTAAALPSRWQERVKNGSSETWQGFSERMASSPRFVEQMTRMRSTLTSWSAALGSDRVHVVTVPPPGQPRELLVDRFCEAAGIPADAMAQEGRPDPNSAIGLEGAELLRRVNDREPGLGWHAQRSELKGFLAKVLAGRASVTSPPLSTETFAAAHQQSVEVVEHIVEAGYPVAGDLQDLIASDPPADRAPMQAEPAEVLDAAVDAVVALSERAHAARREVVRLRATSPEAESDDAKRRTPVARLLARLRAARTGTGDTAK